MLERLRLEVVVGKLDNLHSIIAPFSGRQSLRDSVFPGRAWEQGFTLQFSCGLNHVDVSQL